MEHASHSWIFGLQTLLIIYEQDSGIKRYNLDDVEREELKFVAAFYRYREHFHLPQWMKIITKPSDVVCLFACRQIN
jgi:hypothetical protein